MSSRYVGLLVSILLVIPLVTPLLVAQSNTIPQEALNKIDPNLYRYLSTDQMIEIVIRVKPLPASIASAVAGRYDLAVNSLKSWAEISQRPVVSMVSSLGGKVLNRFWLDNVILAIVPGNVIPKIASSPDVVRIFRNFEVKVLEPVARQVLDPKEFKPDQQVSSWGISKIRAPEVWALGYTGQGVRIAVLDTGVDISHPAIAGKMLTVNPGDPYYPGGWMEFDSAGNPVRSTPHDTDGHGTHCSGTALGGDTSNILIGVAPGATLMHGLVLPGGGGTFAQVLAGMQWTVEPFYLDAGGNKIYTGLPAHVVSMSFGANEYYGNDLLPAIQAMLLANIVPVAAIGNSGPGTASNPGNIWGAFGIGATDINDNVASWSSGKVVTWPSPPSAWPFFDTYPSTYTKPDFSAPGVSITSAVPGGGYEAWSGTSMATPHVAGLVALMLQAAGWHLSPTVDVPEKLYLVLNSTSIDLGTPGQDTRYGWGRVDAYEAVKKAIEYAKKSGVEGVVLDEVSSQPVSWAYVTVVEAGITVSVNSTGGFKIPLDPGNYTLVVSAWGYLNVTITVEVVLLNGTISGLVYNAITGMPVAGAVVTAVEINTSTTTNDNGEFSLSVPPGTYTVVVSASGYAQYSTSVTVDEGELVYLNVPLFPVGNGTIAGYVTHATYGTPIGDAMVYTYVNGSLVYNFTNILGYYELSVPSGIYTVYAYKPGFIEANKTGVIVAPSETTWVNFTLEPIPPTVVVLANVHYRTRPHLKDIVAAMGLPVVEYNNMTKLLEDWMNGLINPAVVVIDHTMPDRFSYPPASIVLLFHQWADAVGSSLIWLGTSYSGETGIDVLLRYNTTLVNAGYPAPRSRLIGYPSPTYVQVTMMNVTHPVFFGVIPDIPPIRFYLGTGSYVDYAVYNFTDPTGRFTILGYVNDTRTGYSHYHGVGVAEWFSNTGKPWYYLGSWAESYWMQYIEPGSDGMYTNNTKRVLENAVLLGWAFVVDSERSVNKELLVEAVRSSSILLDKNSKGIRSYLYTPVTIYLPRQPHGFITGRVVGSDGAVLANALVEIMGTPLSLYTNATGHFHTWLPVGTYSMRISAPGYRPVTRSATIEEGVLTDLGDIVLPATVRVATLYDYGDSLKSFFESKGWYARSYTNITLLTNDILAGMYNIVVYAGYYNVPFPTATEFQAFLNATLEKKVSVLWMDSWGTYGYGIKVLNRYLGDPASVGSSYGYPVYIRVTRPHPILRGYSVGQDVLIITYSSADFSWFTGFSGEAIADTLAGGVIRGNSIAWKELPGGVKWVLLSSFAPTSWNPPTYFTSDAWNIIYNAATWAASRPLTVTVENPYLHVGDTLVAHISDGPALTELIVTINGVEVDRVQTDNYGKATFTYTVPLLPGGTYLLEVYTEDQMYYGNAQFTVQPKLSVIPGTVRTPGVVYLEATGLSPLQLVHIYVDGNWLSLKRANSQGALSAVINLPLLAEGYHVISLVDPTNGETIAYDSIYVTSQLDTIENIAVDIRDKLLSLEPVILSIDNNVATILTKIGVLQLDVDEVKQILNEHNAKLSTIIDDVAIIKTDMGVIRAKLESLEPIIMSIHDMTYQIVVVLDTAIGEIKADLETIKDLIENSREAILAKIDEGVATIILKIEDSTVTILANLEELRPVIEEIHGNTVEILTILGTITADLEYIKSLLGEIAEIVSFVAEGVAVIQSNVGYIMAKLDALEPIIVEIHENTVTMLTQLGEIKADLEDVKTLIELAKEAILAKIDEGVATIILKIEDSTITIMTKLEELQLVIEEIHGNTVEILTILGTITADLDTIKSMLEDCHAVLAYIAETVAVIQTDVGEIKVRLDALEPIILEIRDMIVVLHTQIGEIRADLETIMNMIESAKETLLTEIRDGFATLQLMLANSTATILIRLDDLAELINETKELIIEKIYQSTALIRLEIAGVETRITAKLNALEPVISRIDENVAYIVTKIGLLEVNITTILSALDELDAKIVQIKGDLVVIYTAIGELRVSLDQVLQNLALMNATIVTIMNDVVFIKTSAGQIIAKLDDLMNALNAVNASITGIVVQSKDSILVEITTSRGAILTDVSVVKALIEKGLPISTSELKDILSRLIQDTGTQMQNKINNVESKVDKVGGGVDQAGTLSMISIVLLIVVIALTAYQISLMKRSRV